MNCIHIKVSLIIILPLAILFFSVDAIWAAGVTVTAPEVKKMMETGKPFLVHVLSRVEFEGQHIPGSVNIPINELENSDKLPVDRDRPLIFYCMGIR